jgi:hypothetical protein
MRQASPNTYLPQDVRGAEHPDQPRVPAGNPDGGQWTDGGGGVGSSRPNSIDPINTGSTSARPRAIPVNSTTASGSLTQGGSWIGATLRPFIKKIPGAAAIAEIFDGVRWSDNIDNHVQEYNDLVAGVGNDTSIIPVIHHAPDLTPRKQPA